MQIRLNGEAFEISSPATIASLVAALELSSKKVAVEHNAHIVPRSAYHNAIIAEGDVVEIVAFVGGG